MKGFEELKVLFLSIDSDIRQYMLKDPTMKTRALVIFFSAGFHALLMYRISNYLWNYRMKFIALILHYLSRVVYSIDIHPAAQLSGGIVIDHGIGVVIGSTAKVGSGTIIYHGVTLGARYILEGKRHPDIGRNVVLGAGAKILGPVLIGDNVKVGANSVVLNDVKEGRTVVGVPARVIRKDSDRRVIGFDA